MRYGTFELANYPDLKLQTEQNRFDTLEFQRLPKQLDAASFVSTVYTNWNAVCASAWRLSCSNSVVYKLPPLPKLEPSARLIQGVWLEDLFPGWRERPALWPRKGPAVCASKTVARALAQLASARRFGDIVLAQRPGEPIDPKQAAWLVDFWQSLRVPLPTKGTTQRLGLCYYVFSSSLAGETAREKLASIREWPAPFRRMIGLVADDLSLPTALALGERLGVRVSFDVGRVRDKEGQRITRDHKHYQRLLDTYRANPGSSASSPLLFNSNQKQWERVVKHYCAGREISYKDRDGKNVTKRSLVDAAHMLQF